MGKRCLIACEYSGIVREAFRKQGWDAWSADLLPTEQPGQHYQGDVRDMLGDGWDLMVAHPPCQFMSDAGQRWFKVQPDRMDKAREAFAFFMEMVNAPIPRICVENTRGFAGRWYRRPDQIVHPYQFGHDVTKATCLWLKNLPPLMATLVHPDPFVNWTKYKGSHNGHARSKTWQGIADAMAAQWGTVLEQEAAHA